MIEVIYHRDYHRVTVNGHAGSGEKGHDLVCAAASIISYTLAAAVMNASTAKQVRDPVLRLDEGDAEISCRPANRWRDILTVIFDSICTGYDILAQRHPENIRYEVRG